jgi:peptidylprolyl isomerase
MKTSIIVILVIVLIIIIAGGVYFLIQQPQNQNQQTSTNYNIQGMKIEILKEGNGEAVKSDDTVIVNYVGTLQDGTKFDSSIDRGQTFQFTLGKNSVIQGWELGVMGMKVGEKRKLTIPPELAYGSQGAGDVIPPNATLIFEVDLVGKN